MGKRRAGLCAVWLLASAQAVTPVLAQDPPADRQVVVQRAWTGALPALLWGVATAMIEAGDGLAGPAGNDRLTAARLAAEVAVEGSDGTPYAPLAAAAATALDAAISDRTPVAGIDLMERGQALVLLIEEAEMAGLEGHAAPPASPDAVIGRPVINALGQPLGEVAALATAPDGEKLALVTIQADEAARTLALPAEVLVVGRRAVAMASFLTAEKLLQATGGTGGTGETGGEEAGGG